MSRHLRHLGEKPKAGSGNHDVDREDPVFCLEEGHRSLCNMIGNAGHL